jgi:hypothetical protein
MGSAAEGKAQALKKNVSGQPEAGILQMPGITADRSMYDEEKCEKTGGMSLCGSLVGDILSGIMFYGGNLRGGDVGGSAGE